MKYYDELITQWNEDIMKAGAVKLPLLNASEWPDEEEHAMIFASDMAYELGGLKSYARGASAVTEDASLVPEDEILLVGPDIGNISGEVPYARITQVRFTPDKFGEGEALYAAVRKIEFARYHVAPKDCMFRISAMNDRESLRIGKKAVADGLSFAHIGAHYIRTLKSQGHVEAVRMIFITDPAYDYAGLRVQMEKNKQITGAIDHIFKDASIMDCKACSLQEVCEEVEGLRELHFGRGASPS